MSKKVLIIIAVIMTLAIVCTVGMLVIPEQENTKLLQGRATTIWSCVHNTAGQLNYEDDPTDSTIIQESLYTLHEVCEDLAALTDFYYPPDRSFSQLLDDIIQGAYSPEELKQMGADFEAAELQLQEAVMGNPDRRQAMSSSELSQLLIGLLEKWVRSA